MIIQLLKWLFGLKYVKAFILTPDTIIILKLNEEIVSDVDIAYIANRLERIFPENKTVVLNGRMEMEFKK